MHRCTARAAAALVIAAGLAGAPAAAQAQSEEPGGQSSPEDLAREGAEKLMRALESILSVIPQYGVPRIEENGDIVIPRLNPPTKPKQKPSDQDRESGDPRDI